MARDKEWRKKEPSLKDVQAKYSDLPKSWILKADIQRRGLTYTKAAVDKIDPNIHVVNSDAGSGFRNNLDYVPEGLIWKDGSYLVANFDFDENSARDPYVIDVVDDKIVITDEGEIFDEVLGYWEKPDFYNKRASNGEPLSKYITSRPQMF